MTAAIPDTAALDGVSATLDTVLRLVDVRKTYPGGVEALRGVSLTVRSGEAVAVVGPSGSGKSTLLHVMGTLERQTAGEVHVAGQDTAKLRERALAALRAREIGFVFQQFFLLDGITVDFPAGGLTRPVRLPAPARGGNSPLRPPRTAGCCRV